MSNPKKPQDHLPKQEKPVVESVEGGKQVTLHGVVVTVPDEALDDFELLEDLGKIQADKKYTGLLPSILRRLVGDEGYETVMSGLRNEKGRVPVQSGIDFILALFQALNPNS